MKIKNVFMDIDGTIFNPSNECSDILYETIALAKLHGIEFGLVTSRSLEQSHPVYTKLSLDGLMIIEDGASIVNPDTSTKDILIPNIMEIESTKLRLPSLWKTWNFSKNQAYTYTENSCKEYSISIYPKKRSGSAIEENNLNALVKHFNTNLPEQHITAYNTGHGNVLITSDKVSKGLALEHLINKGVIQKKTTLCIGNGKNDTSMIQYSVCVAVGNAHRTLKKNVSYVSHSNYSEGVIDCLSRFLDVQFRNMGDA